MENEGRLNNEFVLLAGSLGMLTLACATILFIYLFQRKLIKRKLAYQEIEHMLRDQELKAAYALLDAQEQERVRIAEELHDSVGTQLATLSMYGDVLAKHPTGEQSLQLIQRLGIVSRQAADEIRKISHRLDTAPLKYFGLQTALENLQQAITTSQSLAVEVTCTLTAEISYDLSLNLYRIIQELLTNTLKHAHASNAVIELTTVRQEFLSLIYEDNGVGMNSTSPAGTGLQHIRTRVERFNGTLVKPETKRGFTLIIEIPL